MGGKATFIIAPPSAGIIPQMIRQLSDEPAKASGFRALELLDKFPAGQVEIIDVRHGHTSGWALRIELALDASPIAEIVFEDPTGFRAQDEREMVAYWSAMTEEGVFGPPIYTIGRSDYLAAMNDGASLFGDPLTHHLVVGCDWCVEVLSSAPPTANFLEAL